MKRLLALLLLLSGVAMAAPYSWEGPLSEAFLAPTDIRQGETTRGALLQGGLVDVRYGQVSLDLGGTAEVLELHPSSVLTLNGQPTTAEALQAKLPLGLAAVVRYAPDSGRIGWLDAYTNRSPAGILAVRLSPSRPAYAKGETVRLLLPPRGEGAYLIPGLVHGLPARDASLTVREGMDLRDLPIFWISADQTWRVGKLTLAASPPELKSFGPSVASRHLAEVPGWLDFHSPGGLLEPTSIRVTVDGGAEIVNLQRRVGRTAFTVLVPGGGTYWLEAEARDQLGRRVQRRWPLHVR